jgi:hypothetical protein
MNNKRSDLLARVRSARKKPELVELDGELKEALEAFKPTFVA